MTNKDVETIDKIKFTIHDCEKSLEMSEIMITAIKTIEQCDEFHKKEVTLMFKFLKEIDIYITNDGNKSPADYLNGKIRFHIKKTLELLKQENKSEINSIIQQALVHEITHLYHDKKTQYLVNFDTKVKKLKKKLQPTLFNRIIPIFSSNYKREDLYFFINTLFIEGLSTYIQYINKDVDIFELQDRSKDIINQIFENYSNYNEVRKIEKDKTDKYIVGFLMTKIILQDEILNISFKELVEVGFRQFIELYERAAHNQNLEILISYSSNKGILDYQDLIRQWKEEKRELKNK